MTSLFPESITARLGDLPRLSQEETYQAIRDAQAGDQAQRHRVILGWLPYALSRVREFRSCRTDIEDLESEAYLILDRCVDGYDRERGSWPSYIFVSTRNLANRYLEQTGFPVRLPADSLIERRVDPCFIAATSPAVRGDFDVEDRDCESIVSLLFEERRTLVRSAVDALPDPVRSIFTDYFGLDGSKKTLREIGERLGVTKEAIRRRIVTHSPLLRSRLQSLMEDC